MQAAVFRRTGATPSPLARLEYERAQARAARLMKRERNDGLALNDQAQKVVTLLKSPSFSSSGSAITMVSRSA